jgi:hypothetical protein
MAARRHAGPLVALRCGRVDIRDWAGGLIGRAHKCPLHVAERRGVELDRRQVARLAGSARPVS